MRANSVFAVQNRLEVSTSNNGTHLYRFRLELKSVYVNLENKFLCLTNQTNNAVMIKSLLKATILGKLCKTDLKILKIFCHFFVIFFRILWLWGKAEPQRMKCWNNFFHKFQRIWFKNFSKFTKLISKCLTILDPITSLKWEYNKVIYLNYFVHKLSSKVEMKSKSTVKIMKLSPYQ